MTNFETAPPWTDEEHGFLADHPTWSARQVGEVLGRSISSVEKKRAKLKAGWTPIRESWAEDEDFIILQNTGMTAGQVHQLLPWRTLEAVKSRRQLLRELNPGTSFMNGSSKLPWHVGGRTLLAKSCLGCGYFLPASWFWPRTTKRRGAAYPYWESRCRKCLPNRFHTLTDDRSREQKARERRDYARRCQEVTLPLATKNREPWTSSDHEVLADENRTILDKALSLSRTYYATSHQTVEHGYKSKKGIGDPAREAWVILFPEQAA